MNSCVLYNKRNSNGRGVATLVSHAKLYFSLSPSTKYFPVIQTTIFNFTVAKYLLLTQTQMILSFCSSPALFLVQYSKTICFDPLHVF